MDPVSIAAIGWGISTAGWLVSPIISKLLNKSLSYLGSRSSDRLKKLDSKLLRLKHMAEKVEASSSSPQYANLDNWTKKLKSAFYDVEDILDAIDYHHLKTRAVHRSAKPTKQVCSSLHLLIYEKNSIAEYPVRDCVDRLENIVLLLYYYTL